MIGTIQSDDWIQWMTLALVLISIVGWVSEMRFSNRPLFMVPPIIACTSIALFYIILILFPSISNTNATEISSAVRFLSALMWLLSYLAMRYVRRGRFF